MTILDTLRKRLEGLGENPEFIPVSKDELHSYITLYEDLDPIYSTDDNGMLMPLIMEMPLICSFRGVPLVCKADCGGSRAVAVQSAVISHAGAR